MGVFSCGCSLGVFVCMYKHNRRCVSVGLVFVRVFVSVFVGVFVWVGFCITQFNLGRLDRFVELDQTPKCIPDILPEHTISDLRLRKSE